MKWFEKFDQYRDEDADPNLISQKILMMGLMILFSALILYLMSDSFQKSFPIAPWFHNIIIFSHSVAGTLMIIASGGLKSKKMWGKRVAQIAVVVIHILDISALLAQIFSKNIPMTFGIIIVLVSGMTGVLSSYYFFRFLERIPVIDDSAKSGDAGYDHKFADLPGPESFNPEAKNIDGVFNALAIPSEVVKIIGIFLCAFSLVMYLIFKLAVIFPSDLQNMDKIMIGKGLILIIIIFMFVVMPIYNYFPSPFQKARKIVRSFTSQSNIHYSPFSRVLLYRDGLEIRGFFKSIFITYDLIKSVENDTGFLSDGSTTIKHQLKNVPSKITFSKISKKDFNAIGELRDKYLAEISSGPS